jgi:hypothetical protein
MLAATLLATGALLVPSDVLPDAHGVATWVRVEGAMDPDRAALLEHHAWRSVAQALGERALPMDRGLGDYERDRVPESRKSGRELLAQARQLADELETDQALETAEKALESLASALVEPEDAKPLGECHLLLVTLALQVGDKAKAEGHVRRARLLLPDHELDPATAAEDDLALWKRVAKPMEKLPRGELSVETEPTGARVMVDGEDVGFAPTLVSNVKAGPRLVRLSRPGYVPAVVQVEVKPKASTKVTQALLPVPAAQEVAQAIQADPLQGKAAATWTARVASQGVDHAVVVVASEWEPPDGGRRKLLLAGHLIKLADGSRLRRVQAEVEPGTPEERAALDLVKDLLDVARGRGTGGGAAMAPGQPPLPPEPEVVAAATSRAVEPEPASGGGPSRLPILAALGAVGVGAVVVVVVVAGVVVASVLTGAVAYQQVTAAQASARAAEQQEADASARRERARRVSTLGY